MALSLTTSGPAHPGQRGLGGRNGVIAVADVGGAALYGGQSLPIQLGSAEDEVGLRGVVGDGEANSSIAWRS